MPAENHITMTGYLLADPKVQDRLPSSFRMSTYCSGSKAKDNIRRAILTVKSFDHDMVASLSKGDKVTVEGHFDQWETKPKDGERYGTTVTDVMADDNGIAIADDDREDARQRSKARHPQARSRQPEYDESEPF